MNLYEPLRGLPVQTMGYMAGDTWNRDPKRLMFVLSRYKFVAKMLEGQERVIEIGAGDGWASKIVAQHVGKLLVTDLTESNGVQVLDIQKRPETNWQYTAAYALDVFEHIEDSYVFLRNMADLAPLVIIGTPSLESQTYASEYSKRGHIACKSGPELRDLMKKHFRHVLMFGMNDEVVHTGFHGMCHYLFAIGAN